MKEPHSLAVVVAHPDDDSYGCAGSIALHENDPGFRFCLVLATGTPRWNTICVRCQTSG